MLAEFWNSIVVSVSRFDLLDALDILIIAVIIYYILKLASRTRAMQVLRGIGLLFIAAFICEWLRLQAVTWLLNYVISAGALVLVVLFQPELRRALEQIGRGRFLEALNRNNISQDPAQELIRAMQDMSKQHVGALIAVQRSVALGDIIETGTRIEGAVSAELIETIFRVGTALHDGAMVVQDDVIIAAGCFLPLSARQDLDQTVGTRHRAALGLSEVSDALVFVVSEETGAISAAVDGQFIRNLNTASMRQLLSMGSLEEEKPQTLLDKWFRRGKQKRGKDGQ